MSDRPFNRWRDRFADRRPIVVAHRGDSAHAPENTLEAARLGHDSGAWAWEFDVRLSRDGRAVVFHDAGLNRTTDAFSRFKNDEREPFVNEFDLAELAQLDVGTWFLEKEGPRTARFFGTRDALSEPIVARCRSRSVRVPTLREALELTIALDWSANVELKIDGDEAERLIGAVFSDIKELEAEEHVLISSFDHEAVATVARRSPRIAAGVLSAQPLCNPGRYVREWVGADAYHTSIDVLGFDRRSRKIGRSGSSGLDRVATNLEPFASLRRSAVPLLVFTVNDFRPDGLAQKLAEAGASGVFSDFPGEIVARWNAK